MASRIFDLLVTLQGLAHLGDLFRAQTQLASFSAGVAHVEDPEGMPFTTRALGTTAGVMDGALEQRAAQDLAQIGDASHELVAGSEGGFTRHH